MKYRLELDLAVSQYKTKDEIMQHGQSFEMDKVFFCTYVCKANNSQVLLSDNAKLMQIEITKWITEDVNRNKKARMQIQFFSEEDAIKFIEKHNDSYLCFCYSAQ